MASSFPQPQFDLPTADDRTMAVLAHALQMVGGFIAPLVILIVKRHRKFVAFHALQALLLQVAFLIGWFGVFIIVMVISFSVIPMNGGNGGQPPLVIFLVFPFLWLAMITGWITVLVMVIVYSLKAGRGEWARYPVLGSLSRRMLGLDEGAA